MKRAILILFALILFSGVFAQNEKPMNDNSNKLAVLWTSGDPNVAEKMVFMYTLNAKKQGWFDEVVLIIWGPSAKLSVENEMIGDYIKRMQEAGVKTEACMACARMYDVQEKLAEMGVDVKGMGVPLSNYLKEGWKVLSL
ncbi:DsrE family protein [Maribellus sediminis]|uniref:DsrE family protein n=1 Tax=Maribellus sediminis TaxID=2696285 RepID=UPI001F10811A|nr:DsrE family protein [Maribellus sediminis]